MSELYGDLPLKATADFMSKIPEGTSITKVWAYFGKFLEQYYTEHPIKEYDLDKSIIQKLVQSYKDQNHSGYSHLVVTQMIMEYLSGKMSEEEKEQIKKLRKTDKEKGDE